MKTKLPVRISTLNDLELILKYYKIHPYLIIDNNLLHYMPLLKIQITKMKLWQIFRRRRLDKCIKYINRVKTLDIIIDFKIIYNPGHENEK
jgi:hypothetical protein